MSLRPEDLKFNPPSFGDAAVRALLAEQYDLAGDLEPLEGERDQNLLLTTPEGLRFVLKISSPLEDPEVVDFQIRALLHLEAAAPDLPVPRVRRTRSGTSLSRIENEGKIVHRARLVTYLPGLTFESGAPPSLSGLRGIGRFQARLCLALESFSHPAASHFMPWDISNGLVVDDGMWAEAAADLRALAGPILPHLKEKVLPRLQGKRRQVIHNDGHGGNFLRLDGASEEIAGLIDFGDLVEAPLVDDPAIAIASFADRAVDPVAAAAAIGEGFHRLMPLEADEIDLLWDLAIVRLVLSVLLYDFKLREIETPPAFLARERPLIFASLGRMIATDRHEATARLRGALEHESSKQEIAD